MAKQPNNKSGGRFRLVVLEAELGDGNDFSEMAQAIQHALKPAQVVQQRVVSTQPRALPSPNAGIEDVEEIGDETEFLTPEPEARPKKSRNPKSRKVYSPDVVLDLDMSSDPSWLSFLEEKNPETNVDKYLVAAEWCRVARGISEVSADHIFTCFKIANWPTGNPDFSGPLRHLKSTKLMGPGSEKGLYKINHVGSARVDKMGAE